MITSLFYPSAKLALWTGGINLATDPIWVMMLDGSYVPDSSHKTLADLTGEVIGDGYTAGGQALTGQSVTIDPASGLCEFKANPFSWPGCTVLAAAFVFYKKGDTAADSLLIGYNRLSMPISQAISCDPARGFICF